jgi:serine-type D-Ala-D-Ala carboxypeptidase (penicillin-binding protein 5/6)
VVITALLALVIAGAAALLSGSIHRPGATSEAAATTRVRAAPAMRSASTPAPHAAPARVPQLFTTTWLGGHPQPELEIHGQADILVDVDSRQVLWQRDPHGERAPASLTKLVTAMVASDLAPLDQTVTVTGSTDTDAIKAVEPNSTLMGLTRGEKLTVRELMYGLFLRSGNDAAETLGAGIVSRDKFIHQMNQKAADLHMKESHFTTPVGLDDPGMKTSAYDLAIAAATIANQYPDLLAISGTAAIKLPQTATHKEFDLLNYNKMVIPGTQYTYPGATGMKTAFTDDAGPCMVATATRGDRHLVAVVMHSDNFFVDATRLFDYGFSQPVRPSRR